MPPRRIALACLTPRPDDRELAEMNLPSYGIRRIQAAVVGDPMRPDHVVRLFDLGRADIALYVRQILAFAPDLLGFSIYVWSTEQMVAVAREVKRQRPSCVIVFGGPSARSAVFDLEHYRDPNTYLDALVEGDGEVIFREIARLPELTRATLSTIPGLTFPDGRGWTKTGMAPAADLDAIASPFQLGLMAPGAVAYLETFRGCPLSCRFCEWGANDRAKGVFSADYIARELRAIAQLRPSAMFLLDAGLNLNIRAFRNLRQAATETGVLKSMALWAEIYPVAIRDEHLEFIKEVGPSWLGVGLQSMDPAVLELHQRPTDLERFAPGVQRLAAITNVEVQVIFGLPGDSPEGFRRTLDYALALPAGVRAYHCLVLPDALLTRGLPDWNMVFDPHSHAMISCRGWSREDLQGMRAELTERALKAGGRVGSLWWSFPPRRPTTARALPA